MIPTRTFEAQRFAYEGKVDFQALDCQLKSESFLLSQQVGHYGR